MSGLLNRIKNRISHAPEALRDWFHAPGKEHRALPSRGAAAAIGIAALLFGLYYLGVFDLALIERPAAWDDNADRLYAIWNDGGTTDQDEKKEAPETTEEPEKTDEPTGPREVKSIEYPLTKRERNEADRDASTVFPTRADLEGEGYYLTDATFDPASSVIGSLSFGYSFPGKFTYRDMQTRTWVVTEHDDGRMADVEDTTTTVTRPALYLYMGYIIYDDGGDALYLVDRNGTVLMNYNENYLPAFARDRSGNPLFYSPYSYWSEAPESFETDEFGKTTYTHKGAYLTGHNYFALSYGGNYFIGSDYVEERDGRGLNFDFPAWYGLSDSDKVRSGLMYPKVTTFLDGTSELVNYMLWNYFSYYDPARPVIADVMREEQEALAALEAEQEAARLAAESGEDDKKDDGKDKEKDAAADEAADAAEDEEEKTFDELLHERFPYYTAYNYNEGYAVVVTDDTGEEEKYETKELRVIDGSGNFTFTSKKKYYNTTIKNYVSDRYLLPLTRGEESIGSIYFDHGLMRVRKVTYEYYQLEEWGDLAINSDEDVLIRPNGTEFPIPEGYKLKGYADGVLTLERRGLYGYMRYDGTWIADPVYSNAAAFHGGIGVLTKPNGIVGAIDINGAVQIPFRYSYISNRSDSLIAAYSESGGWELFGVFTR